jgi:glycosyltransferase involved in cell wall biosynthesis
MTKKIIFTVTNDLTYDQRMQRICTTLADANYEVLLIGRKLPNSKPLTGFNFSTKRIKCFFNKGAKFYAEYNIRLFIYLVINQFDAICSIDLDTILAGFYANKLKRKIQIYDAHEYFTEVPELVERPKTKAIWEKIANKTIPNIKYAYTVGEGLKGIFENVYHIPFEVIRNVPFSSQSAIQKTDIERVIKDYNLELTDKPIILYQGALNDGRAIEETIYAMKLINNAVLWLAGEGDLSKHLRILVKDLKLEASVKFLGFVLPKDLKVITHFSHIGLNLLKNKGLNYYYSLANKCFDYIQAEKPSLHRNFPEYITINNTYEIGLLLDDLKTETITSALQELLNNQLKYNELKQNCIQAKTVFTWENERIKLLQFYTAIFNS